MTVSGDNERNEESFVIFVIRYVRSCSAMREGAAEGRSDNWGEVVTR